MVSIDDIIALPPDADVVVDPLDWFQTPGPFEVEIGCGKGGFLLSRARSHPDVRILGIEWASKFYRFCADRMARWNLTNVRVMRTDAKLFVPNQIKPGSISVLHVYHPDPWPKKRHNKRRLFQPDFVAGALKVTEPGGRWVIQTDHAEYYEHIRDLLDKEPQLTQLDGERASDLAGPQWAGTNFEVKYEKEGRAIYRVAYRRA